MTWPKRSRARYTQEDNGPSTAAKAGKVSLEKLKLWTTLAPSSAGYKARSLTARAEEARATLRRIVSDPNLRTLGDSKRAVEVCVCVCVYVLASGFDTDNM